MKSGKVWKSSTFFTAARLAAMLAAAVVLFADVASAESVVAATKSGTEVRLRGYARWNKDCESIDPPEIYVELPPKNGFICARVSKDIVRIIREGKAQCVGRSIRGISVIYSPRPNFDGTDNARYTVSFNEVRLTVEAEIRVDNNHSSSEQGRKFSPSESTQTEGPIPVCAALVS